MFCPTRLVCSMHMMMGFLDLVGISLGEYLCNADCCRSERGNQTFWIAKSAPSKSHCPSSIHNRYPSVYLRYPLTVCSSCSPSVDFPPGTTHLPGNSGIWALDDKSCVQLFGHPGHLGVPVFARLGYSLFTPRVTSGRFPVHHYLWFRWRVRQGCFVHSMPIGTLSDSSVLCRTDCSLPVPSPFFVCNTSWAVHAGRHPHNVISWHQQHELLKTQPPTSCPPLPPSISLPFFQNRKT